VADIQPCQHKRRVIERRWHEPFARAPTSLSGPFFAGSFQNSGPPDTRPMSIALLETAIEGHLIISDNEKDTLAFVTDCFKHATDQPKGKLQ
jgi:hypothetical protein